MLYYPKSVIFVFYIAIILFPILKIFAIPKRGIQVRKKLTKLFLKLHFISHLQFLLA